jgi:hypothetical protein
MSKSFLYLFCELAHRSSPHRTVRFNWDVAVPAPDVRQAFCIVLLFMYCAVQVRLRQTLAKRVQSRKPQANARVLRLRLGRIAGLPCPFYGRSRVGKLGMLPDFCALGLPAPGSENVPSPTSAWLWNVVGGSLVVALPAQVKQPFIFRSRISDLLSMEHESPFIENRIV